MFSAPLKPHSNRRFHISKSLYTFFLVMLFLLFLYYLLQGPSIDAGPIPTIEDRSLAGNHCNDLGHCRTIWNIVWSRLATIFSLVPGWPCTLMFLVQRSEIHCCHLLNIAFPCSSVRCLYPSTFWLGPLDSSWSLVK